MIELLLLYGFDTLEYSWVKATIDICMLTDYSVAKKHQQRPPQPSTLSNKDGTNTAISSPLAISSRATETPPPSMDAHQSTYRAPLAARK
jgi:hypothetical protein